MTPEGKVKHAVNKLLDQYIHYRFMPVQSGYGKKTLDYLVCIQSNLDGTGMFVAIETKAPGKKPTELQEACMREIEAAGGKTFVIDGDLTELREWLETYGIRKSEAQDGGRPVHHRASEPLPRRKAA